MTAEGLWVGPRERRCTPWASHKEAPGGQRRPQRTLRTSLME